VKSIRARRFGHKLNTTPHPMGSSTGIGPIRVEFFNIEPVMSWTWLGKLANVNATIANRREYLLELFSRLLRIEGVVRSWIVRPSPWAISPGSSRRVAGLDPGVLFLNS
jgi:hypothetical protein